MTLCEEKLSRLVETVSLVSGRGVSDIADALNEGRGRIAIAIGTRESRATAHFFARCRTTLGLGLSLVMTPMQFVLSFENWSDAEIWLFSSEADNSDISAAIQYAIGSRCRVVRLMTTRHDEATAIHPGVEIIDVPLADSEDGFFAIQSSFAFVAALLIASDRLTESPHGTALVEVFKSVIQATTLSLGRDPIGFNAGDTVFVLYDPQVASVAAMIEAYLWASGIGQVQCLDFRDFATTRYVWAMQNSQKSVVVALTSSESESVWAPINAAMSPDIRSETIFCGDGGRFANATGILTGLAVISRLFCLAGTDLGRHASIPSAEMICDSRALSALAKDLTSAIKHKAKARLLHDPIFDASESLCVLGKKRLDALENARFIGVVLDYDGTVVPNMPAEARFGPPPQDIMSELVRLIDNDVQVGFATGRGQSAGEVLREALPDRVHGKILMGYFNGSHIRTLDVDIRNDPPESNSRVAEVGKWLASSGLLRPDAHIFSSHLQVTVVRDQIIDPEHFAEQIAACPAIIKGYMRVLCSQHTFDVVPAETSKIAVMDCMTRRSGQPDGLMLVIGDSGSPMGNDRELLSRPHAISVDRVCGNYEGSWTLFGSSVSGPEALAKILMATRAKNGIASIDLVSLDFDLQV